MRFQKLPQKLLGTELLQKVKNHLTSHQTKKVWSPPARTPDSEVLTRDLSGTEESLLQEVSGEKPYKPLSIPLGMPVPGN